MRPEMLIVISCTLLPGIAQAASAKSLADAVGKAIAGNSDYRSPRDSSALVGLAHFDDLYVQAIKFDDAVTFHQTAANHWQQDGVEVPTLTPRRPTAPCGRGD